MIQFFIKMTAVIAAAYFALSLPQVGGLSGMVDKLSAIKGPNGINYLNILPDFTNNWDCLLYTSPSPRDRTRYRMPSSA